MTRPVDDRDEFYRLWKILTGTKRWSAGIEYYDYLLAVEFQDWGSGEMFYGYGQGLRSDVFFRFSLQSGPKLHFEYQKGGENSVAFRLVQGPFEVELPYVGKATYEYYVDFATNPFPDGEGPSDEEARRHFYGWRHEEK